MLLVLFQSTLPRGERLYKLLEGGIKKIFQSTLPRGERLVSPAAELTSAGYFNPRSREGSDEVVASHSERRQQISIHAPARGATQRAESSQRITEFQSTLPRGERQTPYQNISIIPSFQSTLPRGERRKGRRVRDRGDRISIHAPARGATV